MNKKSFLKIFGTCEQPPASFPSAKQMPKWSTFFILIIILIANNTIIDYKYYITIIDYDFYGQVYKWSAIFDLDD